MGWMLNRHDRGGNNVWWETVFDHVISDENFPGGRSKSMNIFYGGNGNDERK